MASNFAISSHLPKSMLTSAPLLLFIFIFLILNQHCEAGDVLYSGDTLCSGDHLEYGSYSFIMQYDCNLVLYNNNQPVWTSNTPGVSVKCCCELTNNGNLEVYDSQAKDVWASNTGGSKGKYFLLLQRDGNVVIYGSACAIWTTNTDKDDTGAIPVVMLNNQNETNIISTKTITKDPADA